jgi:pimeloyl-ACP methyl ester carboxylesterase
VSSFERDNLRFNFEEYGSGVPLIFSHGLGGNLALVRDLIGPLEGARVVVYDNRGHGGTSGAGDPRKLTFASMADDVAAVLDHLRIESAVIGGESMGAGIALAFWKRYRQRVRALILSRPAWLNVPYPPNLAILGTMARLLDELGREPAPAHFAQSADFMQIKASYPETAKSLMRSLQDPANSNLSLVYKTIPASVPFEKFEDLGGIDAPTLVLASHDDPLHPFACASRLAAAIPGATLQEFPSKNESVDEHRRVFRRRVSEFIASFPAGSSPASRR